MDDSRNAPDECDGEHDRAHHDGGAEIALSQARGRPRAGRGRRSGASSGRRRRGRPDARGEHVGGEDDQRELQQLGRLDAVRPDRDPGPGVVDRRAEPRRERQRPSPPPARTSRGMNGPSDATGRLIRSPTRRPTSPIAAHVLWRLNTKYGQRPLSTSVDGRRRQHHHQAEHDEHGDDDHDHVVRDGRRPVRTVPQPQPRPGRPLRPGASAVPRSRSRSRRNGRRTGTRSLPP